MQWKQAPTSRTEDITELLLNALALPEVQAGITGIGVLALLVLARTVASRPYRRRRRLNKMDVMQ